MIDFRCGKTALLKYLCSWLGVELMVLDVHGGTTLTDIENVFRSAERIRTEKSSKVYVFLDEVNACGHMGAITSIITTRTLVTERVRIHEDISVLAAMNPYRRTPPKENPVGLVYKRKGLL
jgi:hypothetical protein